MANKTGKYIVSLVFMTILFVLILALCFGGFVTLSKRISYEKLDYRLECVEREERMHGSDRLLEELFFDYDHEEEFDTYWEFVDVELAFTRGRYAFDPSADIAIIENYISNSTDEQRIATAKGYLELMK